ncbi:MAG: flippase [Anaerolineae bacterium]|nr:flippase [Anaerolineae bacterium]
MRRYWRDLVCIFILTVLPLLLFAPVSLGNKTLLPVDALYQFEPFRSGDALNGNPSPHNSLLMDLVLQNMVWKDFLVESLHARSLPLWNPYLFTGQAFLANGQHSGLYPLTWLFFILPVTRAFGVFIVLQLGIAGISMYVFSRTIKASRLGALISGCVFQFSGFLVVSVVHPMIVASASWLPLLLAFVDLTVRRERFFRRDRAMLPWALLGAVVLGVQVLAGHAEITYFSLLVIGVFGMWRLIFTAAQYPRNRWQAEVISPAFGLGLLFALGLCLGAVQLVPLYEVVSTNFRQDAVSLQDVLGWAYPKRRLLTFFIPNFFGNPTHHAFRNIFTGEFTYATQNAYGNSISSFDWGIKNYVEGGAYVGILPLLLAAVAITSLPGVADRQTGSGTPGLRVLRNLLRWFNQPYIPFFTFLSLFSLGCIFGTPLYNLIYALPFFNQSHSPFRWVFPLTVTLSALAGLGLSRITDMQHRVLDEEAHPQPKLLKQRQHWLTQFRLFSIQLTNVRVVAVAAIGSGIVVLAVIWIVRLRYDVFAPAIEQIFWSLANAPHGFPDSRIFFAYLFPWVNLAGLFLTVGGLALWTFQGTRHQSHTPLNPVVWQGIFFLLVLVDLLVFGYQFNPAVDPELLEYTSPVVEFLQSDRGLWRMSTFDPHGKRTFNSNISMLFGLQDVRGYDSIFTRQYARYMGWIEPQNELPYNRIAPFTTFSALDSPLTDLANVKYIVTEEEIPLPKYRLVYTDQSIRVYENLGVTPRAFTLPVYATLLVEDVEAVGTAILEYDPRFYAIIERASEAWTGPTLSLWSTPADTEAAQPTLQTVVHYSYNEVIVDVTIDEPAWLVLTDAFYPGWKAFLRPLGASEDQESETAIARISGHFRGVYLVGSATVRFKYSPNSVKVGAFVSFLAAMTICFLGVIWLWRLIYREKTDSSTAQRLAKNSIAPIVLTLFNRLLDFGIAALLLRILGPQNVGDYTLAVSIFVWFDIITNFGLNTYLTREVARHRDQTHRYLVNTTLIRMGLGIAALPLLIAFIGLRQTLIAGFNGPASTQAILSMLLLYAGLIPNSISTGLAAIFYAYEKAEYPAATTTISTLLKVTFQVIVLIVGWGVVGLAGSSIIVNIVTLGVLSFMAWQHIPGLREQIRQRFTLRNKQERQLRKGMIEESWPLMVNHLLANMFYKIDEPLMEIILGSVSLGLYSIGYKFLDALMVIPSMFTLALFPVISRQAQDDQAKFVSFYRLGTKILLALALPATIMTVLLAREMVLVLGGREYLPGAVNVLQWMAWSMPLSWFNGLTQYVLIALNEQRFLTRAYIMGFLFSLTTNLVLMPRFGYTASAILHIISELALMSAFLIGIRKNLGKIDWWPLLGVPITAALISGLAGVLLYQIGRIPALVGFLLSYGLLLWRMQIFSPEERSWLAPRFGKKKT